MNFYKYKYFIFGLGLFYILSSFVPNKVLYIASYFIASFFFYLHFKNIAVGLIFSLILAFFSELGNNGNLLFFGLYILLLLPFSLRKMNIVNKTNPVDILLFIFFMFNFILIYFNPYYDVLTGILLLSEMICVYYLLRIHLRQSHLNLLMFLILSMVSYQLLIGSFQILFGRNIGLVSETAIVISPYGNTAVEDESLYRIAASFGHANMYSIVLISILPFLFYVDNLFTFILKILFLINIIFTYTRGAWLIGIPLFIILFLKSITHLKKTQQKFNKPFKSLILAGIMFLLSSNIISRLNTIPQALEPSGSFGVRLKLFREAINIFQMSPLIGVGWNRFQGLANQLHVTDIFPVTVFSATTKIHNLFLEIATEVGGIGLIIFILFIILIFRHYFSIRNIEKDNILKIKSLTIYSLISLLLISLFHPVYLVNQFRFFFLIAAIILT